MILNALLAMSALTALGPKLVVVDVDAPDALMGLAAQVTRTLIAEAKAQKLDVMLADEVRSKMDAKRYETLKKCAGKVACAAQELEGLGATRAVLGQLTRDEKSYLLKLWLMDLKGLAVLADVDRPILIASRRFLKDVEQAVPPLLRGEREARGTLVIEANLPDAHIEVNGDDVGRPPVTLSLRPGKYEVKIERTKYLPMTRLMTVEANQETKVKLKLLLMPGQIPDDQVVPALTKTEEATGPTFSALTWILGGAAVAAGATGLTFGLLARTQEQTLRAGFEPQTQTYQGTRALALEQNRNALVANVAFGIAGGAVVGTVISGIVDASKPAVQVAPVVSPQGAGVSVRGSF